MHIVVSEIKCVDKNEITDKIEFPLGTDMITAIVEYNSNKYLILNTD